MNPRNAAFKAWQNIKKDTEKKLSMVESSDTVRETRMGYRGTGFFQLERLYASEGVLTIGVGGPPVAGR